jgi:hypothetical protein
VSQSAGVVSQVACYTKAAIFEAFRRFKEVVVINLKQGTGEVSVSKAKLSRKEVVAELPAPTPMSKRTERDVQTASPRRSGLTVARIFSRTGGANSVGCS